MFIFPDLTASRQQFPMLHKPKLDNVKQYLETKQQRLEEIKMQRQNKNKMPSSDKQQKQTDVCDTLVAPSEQIDTPECKKAKVE